MKETKNSQAYTVDTHGCVCNGQTDFDPCVARERKLWLPHFRTFCELVEGKENKLTTYSTWTIMLGCNESNIIFQQHLCKLEQLRRNNGRNSQAFGQAMKKRPNFRTFCELVEGEENKLTTFYTLTIILVCNESFSSSISANFGNSGETMVEIHKHSVKQ